MCGRYASSRTDADLRREFLIEAVVGEPLAASWNVAPSQPIRVVLTRPPRPADTGHTDTDAGLEPAERQLRTVHWGLVPSWAKDRAIGNRLVNARVETVTEKAVFKAAAARRRCLISADGFYEWEKRDGQARKTPQFLRDPGGAELAFAGLYDLWRDPNRDPDDPDRWWWSAVIITTRESDAFGRIHEGPGSSSRPTCAETGSTPASPTPVTSGPSSPPCPIPASTPSRSSLPSTAVKTNTADLFLAALPSAERKGVPLDAYRSEHHLVVVLGPNGV